MASTATAPPAASEALSAPRTPERVATPVDVVNDAYAHVDWDLLPDPPLTWSTSRLADDNPRKLFHESPYCDDVRRLKQTFTVFMPLSEVSGRYCRYCFPAPRDQSPSLKRALETARQRDVHRELLRLARNAASEEYSAQLRAFQRKLPGASPGIYNDPSELELIGARDAARAAYEALLREFNQAQSAPADSALVEPAQRYAAAGLIAHLERDFNSSVREQRTYKFATPKSTLDLRLMGGRSSQELGTSPLLRKPFDEFWTALAGGHSIEEAAASAVEVLDLPATPRGFDWLPHTLPVPDGASALTVHDLADIWRREAHDVAVAAIMEWATNAQDVLAAFDSIGELTVVVPSQQNPARAEVELNRFPGAFTMRMSQDGTERLYTVPAVVAAWFERAHHANAGTVRLEPSGDNTAEVLDTMGRLRELVLKDGVTTEAMPLADALMAARGIHAAREVTGRSASSQVGADNSHLDAEFASARMAA